VAWARTSSTSTRCTPPHPEVPLDESLEALDALVRDGKVRALGASNFPAWLLSWAVTLRDREGWSPLVSLQPQYSLVERSVEVELLPSCRSAGLGVLPWAPLGAGFLTGRYERGIDPAADQNGVDPEQPLQRRDPAARR
jgi:aryl-alcohol dehydrogenase-like predicted oxidoreductase